MEVFVWRNSPPEETIVLDSDLQFPHSSVLWKVMTSIREKDLVKIFVD